MTAAAAPPPPAAANLKRAREDEDGGVGASATLAAARRDYNAAMAAIDPAMKIFVKKPNVPLAPGDIIVMPSGGAPSPEDDARREREGFTAVETRVPTFWRLEKNKTTKTTNSTTQFKMRRLESQHHGKFVIPLKKTCKGVRVQVYAPEKSQGVRWDATPRSKSIRHNYNL
jgi:hypothetical protein